MAIRGKEVPPDLEIKVGRFVKKLVGLGKKLGVWGKSWQVFGRLGTKL